MFLNVEPLAFILYDDVDSVCFELVFGVILSVVLSVFFGLCVFLIKF